MSRSFPLGFGGGLLVLDAVREAEFEDLFTQLVNDLT